MMFIFNCYTSREIIGPDLVFVILRMSNEDRRKRVVERHLGDENITDIMDVGSQYYLVKSWIIIL